MISRDGVCISDMRFSSEPTSRGDQVAEYVRGWYEENRETWWDRHRFTPWRSSPDRSGEHADEFMLRFISEVGRVQGEAQRQMKLRAAS